MISIRKAQERGNTKTSWLDSRHTFSFGDYYDPQQTGFRALRVINDDRVTPGGGFPTHSHRDMEIVTYVLDGALRHQDSLGNGSVIRSGEIQRMSAGTGITHSEFNDSKTGPVHFLQIWILPERNGLPPSYEQKAFKLAPGKPVLLGSSRGGESAVTIHQDVRLMSFLLTPGDKISQELEAGRKGWLQAARGAVKLNGTELREGDGAAITSEPTLSIEGVERAECLLFDLP